ncbi:MAG: hypothetical protein DI605_04415 [Sphingomonas sp.]|nr:MAG: hypothetical protein DI605_04415 [Sphingomonas sp.]
MAAAAAAPISAATLVVRSAGPSAASYPPGKMLQPTAKLVLKANDQVTLLDEHGTRTLRGPGNFAATATAAVDADSGNTALAALVSQRTDRRVRIGAVRGVESETGRPPNIWFIDASRAGTVCVADPATANLWRPGSDAPAKTVIASATGSARATIDWSPGQAVGAWPSALPITEGARYMLTTGTSAPVEVRITLSGKPAADVQGMASTLIAKGCAAQLDQLVETTAAATKASGGE